METNAPKSKFVYPDKLYARTNDNITLDISYAPQTLEAVEYIRKDAFIEKACEFIKDNGSHYIDIVNGQLVLKKSIIKDFKKYIEGE